MKLRYVVTIDREEDGRFVASVPEVPGKVMWKRPPAPANLVTATGLNASTAVFLGVSLLTTGPRTATGVDPR